MRTLLASASILALASCMPVKADGLPEPTRYVTSASNSSVFTCYLGAFGSGSFFRQQMDAPTLLSGLDTGSSKLGGGPDVGCDYKLNSRMLIGLSGTYTFQSGTESNSILGLTETVPIGNEWALLGRIGFAVNPNTLIYLKGGIVGAPSTTVNMANLLQVPFGSGTGYAVGPGIESSITKNLKAYIEWLHEDFDTRNAMMGGVIPTKFNLEEDTVHVGMRYYLW